MKFIKIHDGLIVNVSTIQAIIYNEHPELILQYKQTDNVDGTGECVVRTVVSLTIDQYQDLLEKLRTSGWMIGESPRPTTSASKFEFEELKY